MSPSSTVHGGQHDTKYVTLELLWQAAFVADEIWGFMLEPTRRHVGNAMPCHRTMEPEYIFILDQHRTHAHPPATPVH